MQRDIQRYLLISPLLIWRLERGKKLLKCQEKPSGVYKWKKCVAARALPQTPLGSLKHSPDPLTGGESADCHLPKNPAPLSAFQALDFSPHLSLPPNFQTTNPPPSELKS